MINALTDALKYKLRRELPLSAYIVLANYYMHALSPLIQLTIPSLLVVLLIKNTTFTTSSLLIVILAILALKKKH